VKATVHINSAPHQRAYGALIKRGLERHGVHVDYSGFDEPRRCDFAVVWGFRQKRVMAEAPHTLVMERGHVGDRQAQTSLGWDGLGGRGRYPQPMNGAWRWGWFHKDLMKPWREDGWYALVIGQVPGDEAVKDINVSGWVAGVCQTVARVWAMPVRYRPHPLARALGHPLEGPLRGVELSLGGALAEDLTEAAVAVTYSSTSGVEAALAGVPVVALDRGSMAWDVATHDLGEPWARPDRTAWAHNLAWTQWDDEEISAGVAWDYLQRVVNGVT
jgi:hypothetical protein